MNSICLLFCIHIYRVVCPFFRVAFLLLPMLIARQTEPCECKLNSIISSFFFQIKCIYSTNRSRYESFYHRRKIRLEISRLEINLLNCLSLNAKKSIGRCASQETHRSNVATYQLPGTPMNA